MVLLSFRSIMAVIAVDRGLGTLMATGAVPAGAPMIHRKGVTANTDCPPAAGIMALRTLASPMTARRGMAGLAIRLSLVVKTGRAPGIGTVTGRTLPGIMIGRTIGGMTRLTVG